MNQNSERPDLVVPEDSVLGGSAGQIDMVPQLIAVLEVQPRIAIHVGRLDLDIDPFFEQPVEDPEHDAFGGQLEAYGERVGIKEDVDLVRGAFSQQRLNPAWLGVWGRVLGRYGTFSNQKVCVARMSGGPVSSMSDFVPYSTSPALVGPDDPSGSCWTM